MGMKGNRARLAGLLDAGMSSLATFLAGLFAVRTLGVAGLGAYAMLFAALKFSTSTVAQSLLVPAEVQAVSLAGDERLGVLRSTLALAGGFSVALAALSAVTASFLTEFPSPHSHLWMTVTSAVAAAAWPLQDHVRRTFHLAGRSGLAAIVSGVQVVATVGSLALMLALGIDPYAIPFGALAVANLVSFALGRAIVWWSYGAAAKPPRLVLRDLLRSGRWLALAALPTSVAALGVAAIVTALTNVETLGRAEAARIVCQPLLVFAMGLFSVTRPGALESGKSLDLARARSISWRFLFEVSGFSVLYFLIVGGEWAWNPFRDLAPGAYEVPGLIPLTLIANVVFVGFLPMRAAVVGWGRVRQLVPIEVVANSLRLAVASTSVVLGSLVVPSALLVMSTARVGTVAWLLGGRRQVVPGEEEDPNS